jgi:hypothetical protein
MEKVRRRLKGLLTRLQTAWSIVGITLTLLILVEGGFWVVFALRDRVTAVSVPDPRVVAEGYGGAAWPIVHYHELEQLAERWQPYVYFRQKPFWGKTITIDNVGRRTTWQSHMRPSARGNRRSVKVLTLGGSSLWGFGARDLETIPSLLARLLDEKGWDVQLENLTEIGYVSTQEVVALVRALQTGARPDVVIFYDGVNDTTSALLEGEPGVTTNEINRRREFNLLQSPGRMAAAMALKVVKDSGSYRFAQMVRRRLDGETGEPAGFTGMMKVPDVGAGVVRHYEANVTIVKALAKSFGFRALFFWQPTVFSKSVLAPFEQEEAQRYAWAQYFIEEVYGEVRASKTLNDDPSFQDLSTIFNDSEGLAFIDYCHTTETANAKVASAMAAKLLKALEGRQENK